MICGAAADDDIVLHNARTTAMRELWGASSTTTQNLKTNPKDKPQTPKPNPQTQTQKIVASIGIVTADAAHNSVKPPRLTLTGKGTPERRFLLVGEVSPKPLFLSCAQTRFSWAAPKPALLPRNTIKTSK